MLRGGGEAGVSGSSEIKWKEGSGGVLRATAKTAIGRSQKAQKAHAKIVPTHNQTGEFYSVSVDRGAHGVLRASARNLDDARNWAERVLLGGSPAFPPGLSPVGRAGKFHVWRRVSDDKYIVRRAGMPDREFDTERAALYAARHFASKETSGEGPAGM